MPKWQVTLGKNGVETIHGYGEAAIAPDPASVRLSRGSPPRHLHRSAHVGPCVPSPCRGSDAAGGCAAGTVNDKEKKLIADMLPDLKSQARSAPPYIPPRSSRNTECRLTVESASCQRAGNFLLAHRVEFDCWMEQAAKGVEWAKANIK